MQLSYFYRLQIVLFTLTLVTWLLPEVRAAGFQIQEQNASHLGTAYSGVGSHNDNASAAFYNPALLTQVSQQQMAQACVLAHAEMQLQVLEARSNLGTPVQGDPQVHVAQTAPLPAFHYAQRLAPHWSAGLSVVAPFGVHSEYAPDSAARYMATQSSLIALIVSPSLAYQWSPHWSFAVGPDGGYIRAELDANLGSGLWYEDGFQHNQASDWGLGWHAAMAYQPHPKIKFGLTMRSRIPVSAEGESVTSLLGTLRYQTVTARVDLPESIAASLSYQLLPRWHMLADAQWTRWSRFDVFRLSYSSIYQLTGEPIVNVTEIPEHFRNTLRSSIGFTYAPNTRWLWKGGVAYDPTPTRPGFRTVRIPDADRLWCAFGVRYRASARVQWDIGYAHLWFRDITVNDEGPRSAVSGLPLTQSYLSGRYHTSADLLGVQISWDLV